MQPLIQTLAQKLALKPAQVQATVELVDGGNTLPFIARYRKEATGGLDEEQLRCLIDELKSFRALQERREAILKSLSEQGKLSPDLERAVQAAESLTRLEDLYLPHRPKRKTRASIAREKGLGPLAERILAQAPLPLEGSPEDLAGARDIVAETVAEHPDVRRLVREKALRFAALTARKIEKAEDARGVFATYYEFTCPVGRLRPHQTLAMDRGEHEKILRLSLEIPERDWREAVSLVFRANPRSPWSGQLTEAIEDAAARLLLPAVERETRRHLTEAAHQHAIASFATNLRGLLSTPPLAGHTVLGIDPGFRTGCKVAVVDPTGKVLTTGTIYPHEPQRDRSGALRSLQDLIARLRVTLVAIGNGTASRETEQLAPELKVPYLMVSEAGASVYSASPLARAELPELDVSLRGAVSIARRAQDPLAELVKIEPRSIGVGMYQHDVDQTRLEEALGAVVESVVNQVGVDLNTASPALLTHVAGIGPKLAEKIVAHRYAKGPFSERKGLLKVAGLGPRAFEQAAGFLRIRGGKNPLDASAIHPESYPLAEAILKAVGLSLTTPPEERAAHLKTPSCELARQLGAGEPTVKDILEQLVRPGRDPREDLPPPLLRQDVVSLDDLQEGMRLAGTVRNVVDFGAFIDIGVKQDGLLHVSQLRGQRLAVGQVLEVEVRQIERQRGRISLGL